MYVQWRTHIWQCALHPYHSIQSSLHGSYSHSVWWNAGRSHWSDQMVVTPAWKKRSSQTPLSLQLQNVNNASKAISSVTVILKRTALYGCSQVCMWHPEPSIPFTEQNSLAKLKYEESAPVAQLQTSLHSDAATNPLNHVCAVHCSQQSHLCFRNNI